MTRSQKKAARQYLALSSSSEKTREIRGVYSAAGRAGLKLMADDIAELSGRNVTVKALARYGRIGTYNRRRPGQVAKPGNAADLSVALIFQEILGSGGKVGKGGGRQNIRNRQFFSSM